MCQNTCYSLSSITSGFVSFFAVLVGIFLIALLELEVLIREKTSVERIYHMSPNPSPLSVHCLLSFRSNQLIHLKKNTWALSHEFQLVSFLHIHVLFETNGVSFILSRSFQ